MAKIKNISTGPRGAYLGPKLVMAERGETIEADDFAPEWFEEVGAEPKPAEPASAEEIVAAIELLDAANDEHWTAGGLPAVDAVAELAGKQVTRKAIEAAVPDAKRPEPKPAE